MCCVHVLISLCVCCRKRKATPVQPVAAALQGTFHTAGPDSAQHIERMSSDSWHTLLKDRRDSIKQLPFSVLPCHQVKQLHTAPCPVLSVLSVMQ